MSPRGAAGCQPGPAGCHPGAGGCHPGAATPGPPCRRRRRRMTPLITAAVKEVTSVMERGVVGQKISVRRQVAPARRPLIVQTGGPVPGSGLWPARLDAPSCRLSPARCPIVPVGDGLGAGSARSGGHLGRVVEGWGSAPASVRGALARPESPGAGDRLSVCRRFSLEGLGLLGRLGYSAPDTPPSPDPPGYFCGSAPGSGGSAAAGRGAALG